MAECRCHDKPRLQLSRPAVITAAVSATAGLATGVAVFLHRSEQIEPHVNSTSAWLPHLVVLAIVATWFSGGLAP